MELTKYTEIEEDTAVSVPNPNKSGTYEVGSLENVEKLLARATELLQRSGDPTDPAFLVRVYLLGYRDSLMGRKPNVLLPGEKVD